MDFCKVLQQEYFVVVSMLPFHEHVQEKSHPYVVPGEIHNLANSIYVETLTCMGWLKHPVQK